jgi:hypothetical protein
MAPGNALAYQNTKKFKKKRSRDAERHHQPAGTEAAGVDAAIQHRKRRKEGPPAERAASTQGRRSGSAPAAIRQAHAHESSANPDPDDDDFKKRTRASIESVRAMLRAARVEPRAISHLTRKSNPDRSKQVRHCIAQHEMCRCAC